jgi:hypothetical protein
MKKYTAYRRVYSIVEYELEASCDEEAIKIIEMCEDERVGIIDEQFIYPEDFIITESGESFIQHHPSTIELYSEDGDMIWDNMPISMKRDNKLNELLGD